MWTEGRIKSFIISGIRSAFRRWPPKYECLANASVGRKVNKATGRLAEHKKCASCGGEFPSNKIEADHIEPVIDPKTGFIDWNTYISRIAVGVEGYQALCLTCHKEKTNLEKQQRKLYADKTKRS